MKIEKGMFIRYETLLIYFEVEEVFKDMVVCAARDPKDGTDLVFIDRIVDCVDTPPCREWIKLNRTKGFYDKFHPEGWHGDDIKVIPFNDIVAGMTILTYKGSTKTVKKVGNTWHCKGTQKTITSKNADSHHMNLVQSEGYKG